MGVKFIHEKKRKKAHISQMKSFQKEDINELHIELGHPSEVIMQAMGKAMDLN